MTTPEEQTYDGRQEILKRLRTDEPKVHHHKDIGEDVFQRELETLPHREVRVDLVDTASGDDDSVLRHFGLFSGHPGGVVGPIGQ